MDFNTLTPVATEIVTPAKDNPTVPWIRASYDADQARAVTVPASEAKALYSLLVKGAEIAGLGLTIRVFDGKTDHVASKELWSALEKAKSTATVVVKFRAKKRTVRTRKDAQASE